MYDDLVKSGHDWWANNAHCPNQRQTKREVFIGSIRLSTTRQNLDVSWKEKCNYKLSFVTSKKCTMQKNLRNLLYMY